MTLQHNEPSISFRPLGRSDFPQLQRWLAEPHVEQWWHEPLKPAEIEAKYGPRVDGVEPTYVYVVEYDERAVGWIQWYRWSDYPEHAIQLGADLNSAGIDLAIGEPQMIGLGIGTTAIREFIDRIVFLDPRIRTVIGDPEESNLRSLRAFEKAGFRATRTVQIRGEIFRRQVVRLERSKGSPSPPDEPNS